MESDIDVIKKHDPCSGKFVNAGDYTVERVLERLSSKKIQYYFIIQNLLRDFTKHTDSMA